MTETSHAAIPIPTNNFRIGSVIVRSVWTLRRHLPLFLIVSLISNLPMLLFASPEASEPVDFEAFSDPPRTASSNLLWALFVFVTMGALGNFAQAILIHRALQGMRLRGS